MRVLVVEDERTLARTLRIREPKASAWYWPLLASTTTGRPREDDETDAFNVGADDFVSKPFSPVVLVARLRALLLRSSAGLDPSVPSGRCGVAPERSRNWLGDQER